MKHGSTTSLQSQIGSQPSGHQQVKAVQSDQRHKHQQARFWPPYLGYTGYFLFIDYLRKGRTIDSKYHTALLLCFKKEIAKNSHKRKRKKCSFTKTIYRVTSRLQLHELHFNLFPYPPYSPDLAPSDSLLFADLKRMLQGKRFGSNEEMILETKRYFEAKEKSF